jgi:hypothetical protein
MSSGTEFLKRLQTHVAGMDQYHKEMNAGKLLVESESEIARLIAICTHVHDRLLRGDDDVELLSKLSEGWNGPKPPTDHPASQV